MREIDSKSLQALWGSRATDKLRVYAWYAGELSWDEPLPLSSWSMSWDITRQIQTMSLEVNDSTGELAPWLLEDPLGVGGAQLQVMYDIGGAGTVNMGWYRITHSDPDETWRGYIIDNLGQINRNSFIPKDKMQVFATGGATISLQAADLGINIKNNRLVAPQSPPGVSPTAISEIKRFVQAVCPVKVLPGITDVAVNKKTIYEVERLDAVDDLCALVGGAHRMNGDGFLEVYPVAEQTPVWQIQGGPEGALVKVNRSQSIEGLYNAFIAEGTTEGDAPRPIRGVAYISDGPLRHNGPHGSYPVFFNSSMITTQAQANAYAKTMRDTQLRGLRTELVVTCLPHPALQQGDWVTVASPIVNRQIVTLNGRVKKMDLASAGSTVGPMSIVVDCSYTDVQRIMSTVVRNEN